MKLRPRTERGSRILELDVHVRWALSALFALTAVLLDALPRTWSALLIAVLAAVLFVSLEWVRFARLGQEQRSGNRSNGGPSRR